MKQTIQLLLLLVLGVFLIESCTGDKPGETNRGIPEKIVLESQTDSKKATVDSKDVSVVFKLSENQVQKVVSPAIKQVPEPPILRRGYEPPAIWRPEPPDDYEIKRIVIAPASVQDSNSIVDFPDVDPEFKGGAAAMLKFIQENIQYPTDDLEAENQGRVYVSFIVEKDGSITNIEVMRGVSPGLDAEAIRLMKLMPKWKPGEVNGKAVRCRSRLPLSFHVQ